MNSSTTGHVNATAPITSLLNHKCNSTSVQSTLSHSINNGVNFSWSLYQSHAESHLGVSSPKSWVSWARWHLLQTLNQSISNLFSPINHRTPMTLHSDRSQVYFNHHLTRSSHLSLHRSIQTGHQRFSIFIGWLFGKSIARPPRWPPTNDFCKK